MTANMSKCNAVQFSDQMSCNCGNVWDMNDPYPPECKKEPTDGEPVAQYNRKRIGWELERTAMGDGYYGNALRVAKDFPELSDEDRSVLDRYATGAQRHSDHIALQDIAMKVYAAPQPAEQQPTCAYACTVPDDCETLHWRGQILSMNELVSAQPAVDEEIHVHIEGRDVLTLPLVPSGMSAPRFVVHVPAQQPVEQQPASDVDVLMRLSDYVALQAAYEEELFCVRQDRDTHFGELMRALEQVDAIKAECEELRTAMIEAKAYIEHYMYGGSSYREPAAKAIALIDSAMEGGRHQ